jgi:transcriptional regulator with XRE-family HTH domain
MRHVSPKIVSAPLTSEIIRAARMLLRWDQKTLAEASGVSHVTVRRLEAKPGPLVAERSTIAKLRAALESAGVVFIEDEGYGPGLRLQKAPWRQILEGGEPSGPSQSGAEPGSDGPSGPLTT